LIILSATALIYDPPADYHPETERVKFVFDADAVVFSEEYEFIYKSKDLETFHKHEDVLLNDGPFADLLKKLAKNQEKLPMTKELTPLRIAIVTARNAPSHRRVIKTLRHWGV
jgi:5'-nucleotidase